MLAKWPEQFAKAARQLQPTRVVNASRVTALECFERMRLEKALTIS